MEASKTTCKKKTAYRIREILDQAVFKMFLSMAENDGVSVGDNERAFISRKAKNAVSAVMQEPKIEIILKRGKK